MKSALAMLCVSLLSSIVLSSILGRGQARAAEHATVAAALAEGERRYGDLDYRGAASVCSEAAEDSRATSIEQSRGWSCVGISWLVLNQRGLAKSAFDKLFTLDPKYAVEDPSLSPRQRDFIEEIRAAHPAPKVEPVVVVTPPRPPDPPPPPPPKKPVYKRWYLWTPIVLVAVGLGVGLGLGLTLGRPSTPTGTLPPGVVGLALHY